MSQYTTGELAKLCGVSVRTVQYYDARGILAPSALSEGGRRLYSEADAHTMKSVCFLRELGMPLSQIAEILQAEEGDSVISLLLQQQAESLEKELDQRSRQLERTRSLLREMQRFESVSVTSLADVAQIMENRKQLKHVHRVMLLWGIAADLAQIVGLLLWIFKGLWWAYVAALAVAVVIAIPLFRYWYARTAYVCPTCQTQFRPMKKEAFWARHTPTTRKLTCPACGVKRWCVETCAEL